MKFLIIASLLTVAVTAVPAGRIVGGHDANPHEAPYMVTINWAPSAWEPTQHVCSGVVITCCWVLTAASCYIPWGHYTLRTGQHNVNDFGPTVQNRTLERYVIHAEYDGGIGPNDIAMFRVTPSLNINEFVSPVGLPPQGRMHSGSGILYGWGSTSYTTTPSFPDILQTVEKSIITNDECRALPIMQPDLIFDSKICTGPVNAGISACNGDSGSPFVIKNDDARDELIGIVSWGFIPCGNGPTVHTRISSFTQWIQQVITDDPDVTPMCNNLD